MEFDRGGEFMQVNTLSVQFIFEKDVFHQVPLFQRPYVWNREDQWEPLWNDIRRLSEKVLNRVATAHNLSVDRVNNIGSGTINGVRLY